MHGRPGTTNLTRPALAALVVAFAASSVSLGDPPPFLPPSLQKVVEQARENAKSTEPRAERSDAALRDLRDAATGELTLGEVIDRLGSDDLDERDRATEVLTNAAMWDEEVLAKACGLPDVCAERRTRLRFALYTRFINSPRPAVGISMGGRDSTSGILVAGLQPGFPAGRVLRVGDELLVIGGVDLRPTPGDQRPLMASIASFDPGDTIDLLVLRDGREIELQIELGSWDDLDQQVRTRPTEVMQRALALRMHRLGYDLDADTGRPIAAPISRFDWNRASKRQVRPAQNVLLVSGGEPSLIPGRPEGGLGSVNQLAAMRAERARNDFKQPNAGQALNQEIREKILAIDQQIESLSEKINDPRATEMERAAFREQMKDLARQRQRLNLVAADPNR